MKRIALAAMLLLAVVAYRGQSFRSSSLPRAAASADMIVPYRAAPDAGFQAHIDTTTGDFIDSVGFIAPDLPEGLLDSLSSDDDGLVEEPAPGGGIMVRTAGRYHNIYWGTRTKTGEAKATCLSPQELKQEIDKP